jgi:hypothetical protein
MSTPCDHSSVHRKRLTQVNSHVRPDGLHRASGSIFKSNRALVEQALREPFQQATLITRLIWEINNFFSPNHISVSPTIQAGTIDEIAL